ncbi:MAG: toxin-antitoxin system HicB family antitoxin [Blastocatellia bacterium]|nr:toxin-antitoxin system HicB family antitoxin [Blastocatellia bacterium]
MTQVLRQSLIFFKLFCLNSSINIPESLFEKLKEAAEKDRSTPEQFAVLAIAEKLSSLLTVEYLEERARRADPERFEQLLSKVPDVEPEDHDRL